MAIQKGDVGTHETLPRERLIGTSPNLACKDFSWYYKPREPVGVVLLGAPSRDRRLS